MENKEKSESDQLLEKYSGRTFNQEELIIFAEYMVSSERNEFIKSIIDYKNHKDLTNKLKKVYTADLVNLYYLLNINEKNK
jgi:hypothetical protein